MKPSFLPALVRAAASVGFLAASASSVCAAGLLTLHTFDALNEGNTPYPVLTQGADGLLYGTTSANGPFGNGSLFRLRTDGGAFTVLSTFPGTNAGSQPRAGLTQARDGNFYGTTYRGGTASEGTLFQLTPAGVLTYLATFTEGLSPGASPAGTLVEGRDGLLYGTAQYGGQNNFGTVYRFALPTNQNAGQTEVVAAFAGDLGGSYPQSDLCLSSDGRYYGTTTLGGQFANGIFFRLSPQGGYQVLYTFGGNADGGSPSRGVVQGGGGAFYGVTSSGGTYGAGTVYRIDVNGDAAALTVLHEFYPAVGEGSTPIGLPVVASDGNLYGTTTRGGFYNNGCIFRVGFDGSNYATVYSFTNTSDGGDPLGGLIQGSDGRLYGTTAPVNGALATVFQLDLSLPLPGPVPQALLTNPTAPGGTVLIQGRNFVGTTAVDFTAANGQTVAAASFRVLSGTIISAVVPSTALNGAVRVTTNGRTVSTPDSLNISYQRPAFFTGEVALSNGVYYLAFPNNGNLFGYYAYLSDPRYLYHFDLGYEYVFDAGDGVGGVYLYDFTSGSFFYTSPTFPFPYLYDFSRNSVLYYFPDPNLPGRYTSAPRYFYDFGTGQVISK